MVGGCVGWIFVVVVRFWVFFKIPSSFSFHSSREKDGLQRSSHPLDVTVCFGELLCLMESGRSRMPS